MRARRSATRSSTAAAGSRKRSGISTASTTGGGPVATLPRLHLRERIHLGIALHAAVNIGFALAVTVSTVPVAAADADGVPIAFDPSPALDDLATLPQTPPSSDAVELTSPGGRPAARQARVTATIGGTFGDRFDRLARCESGGNATAVSPTGRYRGAFQFSLATWQAAGGSGDPIDVSYDEQKQIAMTWARAVEPATQWPVCWTRTA